MKNEKFADILKAGLERFDYVVAKEKNNSLVVLKDSDVMVELNTETMERIIQNENLYKVEKSLFLKTINDLKYVYDCFYGENNSLGEKGSVYHKKLCEFGDTVLAVGLYSDNVFEYATWDINREDNSYFNGKYFMDYDMAKENFASRSGMVDENRIFNDNQLKIIKDILHEFIDIDNESIFYSTAKQVSNIFEVIEKIEEVIPKSKSTHENVEETQSENESFGMEM